MSMIAIVVTAVHGRWPARTLPEGGFDVLDLPTASALSSADGQPSDCYVCDFELADVQQCPKFAGRTRLARSGDCWWLLETDDMMIDAGARQFTSRNETRTQTQEVHVRRRYATLPELRTWFEVHVVNEQPLLAAGVPCLGECTPSRTITHKLRLANKPIYRRRDDSPSPKRRLVGADSPDNAVHVLYRKSKPRKTWVMTRYWIESGTGELTGLGSVLDGRRARTRVPLYRLCSQTTAEIEELDADEPPSPPADGDLQFGVIRCEKYMRTLALFIDRDNRLAWFGDDTGMSRDDGAIQDCPPLDARELSRKG